jgi:ubiquinone/menaquinone biosynthesis C-methylase UbiE
MTDPNMVGTLDSEYANARETRKSLKYRLWRRTFEVMFAINKYAVMQKKNIIDLGTADGRMLQKIYEKYPESSCIGIEYNYELVQLAHKNFPELKILQGDIQMIDYPDNFFDVAIATAVIEHVLDPAKAVSEAKRILKPGGVLILSSPDPFWEYIATKAGLLDNEQHNEVMSLKQLSDLIEKGGFKVLEAY